MAQAKQIAAWGKATNLENLMGGFLRSCRKINLNCEVPYVERMKIIDDEGLKGIRLDYHQALLFCYLFFSRDSHALHVIFFCLQMA